MIKKLKRKPVIIGIISFIAIALALAFTIPAFAAGGSPPSAPTFAPDKNFTVVQGTINKIDSGQIEINIPNSTNPVILGLDSNTNFAMHGVDWFNPAVLAGKPVTAIYKNNQSVTPPVASQIMINMPKPPEILPKPPVDPNISKVQGTLIVNGDGSITIGDVSGIKLDSNTNLTLHGLISLASGANKNAAAIYNEQTKLAMQVMVNIPDMSTATKPTTPAPPWPFPGKDRMPPIQNTSWVQGTLKVNSSDSITLKTPKGTEINLALDTNTTLTLHGYTSLSDADGKTAMAVYKNNQTGTPVASMINVNMPQLPIKASGPRPTLKFQ